MTMNDCNSVYTVFLEAANSAKLLGTLPKPESLMVIYIPLYGGSSFVSLLSMGTDAVLARASHPAVGNLARVTFEAWKSVALSG